MNGLMKAGIALLGFAMLVGCSSASTLGALSTSATVSVDRGIHFARARLTWDRSLPVNPGGPNMRVSGQLVSGSGAAVEVGAIKVYVLDGVPGRTESAVATIGLHASTFARTFGVVGPGGHKIRLDYVVDGKVLASTVVKG